MTLLGPYDWGQFIKNHHNGFEAFKAGKKNGDGSTMAGLQGVLDPAGIFAPGGAFSDNKHAARKVNQVFDDQLRDLRFGRNQGLARVSLGTRAALSAFAPAERGIRAQKLAQTQGAEAGGYRAEANATQSAIRSGLYNTTTFDAAKRGISSSLASTIAQIGMQAQANQAGLDVQRGQAVAAGFEQQGAIKDSYALMLSKLEAARRKALKKTKGKLS